jgi:hypothetical protein
MTVRTVYCSACDRNVMLVVEPEQGAATEQPEHKICLDYGDRCTGEMCPILAMPSEEVRANLARLRAQQ